MIVTMATLAGVAAIWIAFSAIVGRFARSRGRSGIVWFVNSVTFSPILSTCALAMLPDLDEARNRKAYRALMPPGHGRCPNCGAVVNTRVMYCKRCGVEFMPLRSAFGRA